jgi:hypothetical protein
MTLLQWSAWLMLMACGLWSGVILTFQVERINLWAQMPIEQYAVDFRRSLFRVDPMQPILAALACISGGYFAWFSLGTPRLLAWVGVGLMVASRCWMRATSPQVRSPPSSWARRCRSAYTASGSPLDLAPDFEPTEDAPMTSLTQAADGAVA